MDLNAVHMLIKVAETKSFTQAASQLGTSQSRISRTIAQLEEELGTRLLHRNTRNVSLTPDGCELVGWIASGVDPDMACREENLALLDARLGVPRLGDLPPVRGPDPAVLASRIVPPP